MIELPEAYRNAVTFAFGDTPKLADDLIALVLAGKKRATCGALRDFGPKGDPMPVVGRRDIVLDGAGPPAAVIETVEIVIRRFVDVDAEFAFDEGEDDQTLEAWRVGRGLFRPQWGICARHGIGLRAISPDRHVEAGYGLGKCRPY